MVARNFESPADTGADNVYNYTLVATDADGNTANKAVAVTVADVVETSTLTIGNLADSSVNENAAYTSATPSLTGAIGAVTYSLTGDDAGLFTVNASTGAVSMVARNFESPADTGANNVYNYTLVVTDEDGNTANQAVAVTVTDVVEPINGTNLADTIDGTSGTTSGSDIVFGLDGNDTINTGGGNDSIYGGLGFDTMTGGAGADQFVYESSDQSQPVIGTPGVTLSLSGLDVITDFNVGGTFDSLVIPNAYVFKGVAGAVNTNGTDSVQYGSNSSAKIGEHLVDVNGIVTFYETNGKLITLDSTQKIAAAVDYLSKNDLNGASASLGATVAFTAKIGTSPTDTYVYTQYDSGAGAAVAPASATYAVVKLENFNAAGIGLATDTTKFANYVYIG